MKDKSEVDKADILKLTRDGGPVPCLDGVPKSGVKPHPIRKKAWYRALKRGELWAVVPYEHMKNGGQCFQWGPNKFARVIPDNNCPSNTAYIMWPFEE